MLTFAKRLALETEDRLRYHPRVRGVLSRATAWRDRPPAGDDPQALARSIVRLSAAARLAPGLATQARLQAVIRERVARLDADRLDWAPFVAQTKPSVIWKAAILKPYAGPNEKGVVFISFEYEWIKLLWQKDRRGFADRYTVVLSPSGSPHNLINYVFPAAFPAPVYTLLSNPEDEAVLPGVSDRLRVVPLYASSWVDPALYQPLPRAARTVDLIMVAGFAKFKRHLALFRALRAMPRDLRLLLIGQDQDGRTADTVREMARWYGVADRFELRPNQPYTAVRAAFPQARASLILSRREGSCVAVAESLMADVPAAVLTGAELGSRVFLNEQTGCYLDERNLARELTAFVREADAYQPRRWAEEHIACHRSTRTLNEILKRDALTAGAAWTQDLAALHWVPDPQLADPADRARLAAERRAIHERFGLEIGPPLVE